MQNDCRSAFFYCANFTFAVSLSRIINKCQSSNHNNMRIQPLFCSMLLFCLTTIPVFSQKIKNETELRLGAGFGTTQIVFIEATNGIKIGLVSIGAGVGVHSFDYPSFDKWDSLGTDTHILIPVFFNLQSNFIRGEISPLVSLGIGYSFNASDGFAGYGTYINMETGLSLEVIDDFFVSFRAGYVMQSTQETNNMATRERHYAGSPMFRVSFAF
ncbi:MAG: hypothetical protein LBR75_02510 [Prevotellaceae bacterium]|jgi:hypothetical protein|nr:hypothetical protein [Prevotellaceae bacterium]